MQQRYFNKRMKKNTIYDIDLMHAMQKKTNFMSYAQFNFIDTDILECKKGTTI